MGGGGGGGEIPIDPGGGEVMDKFVHSRDVVQNIMTNCSEGFVILS